MKIKWNFWVYHGKSEINRCAINSIDFNPFQNFLVTSGKDNLLKIWNFDQIRNFNKIMKKERSIHPDNLCKIFENNGLQINIIRWSPDGRFLASGGDNGKLAIYYKSAYDNEKKNSFKIFHVFRNFQDDIISLNWSPDSNFITITSLNNTIIIIAIKKKSVFAKIVSKSFSMKGACWDPLGDFIVTQSYSQGVKIWGIKKLEIV